MYAAATVYTPSMGCHEYDSAGIASASATSFSADASNWPRNSPPNPEIPCARAGIASTVTAASVSTPRARSSRPRRLMAGAFA